MRSITLTTLKVLMGIQKPTCFVAHKQNIQNDVVDHNLSNIHLHGVPQQFSGVKSWLSCVGPAVWLPCNHRPYGQERGPACGDLPLEPSTCYVKHDCWGVQLWHEASEYPPSFPLPLSQSKLEVVESHQPQKQHVTCARTTPWRFHVHVFQTQQTYHENLPKQLVKPTHGFGVKRRSFGPTMSQTLRMFMKPITCQMKCSFKTQAGSFDGPWFLHQFTRINRSNINLTSI